MAIETTGDGSDLEGVRLLEREDVGIEGAEVVDQAAPPEGPTVHTIERLPVADVAGDDAQCVGHRLRR